MAAAEHYEGGAVRHAEPAVMLLDVEGGDLTVEQVRAVAPGVLEAADMLERVTGGQSAETPLPTVVAEASRDDRGQVADLDGYEPRSR